MPVVWRLPLGARWPGLLPGRARAPWPGPTTWTRRPSPVCRGQGDGGCGRYHRPVWRCGRGWTPMQVSAVLAVQLSIKLGLFARRTKKAIAFSHYELQSPRCGGSPCPRGWPPPPTMDQAGGLSIISSDPEIFFAKKSRGDLATPVPPHRAIWHKTPQAGGGLLV